MKSLTKSISIGVALKTHKCRFNKTHVIAKGDKRLQVKEGRSQMNYCLACAEKAVRAGIDNLNAILSELGATSSPTI